jgi:tripartite-type tricarboxylate transporter receptor subunit TctC
MRKLFAGIGAAFFMAHATSASAQTYPARPIKIIGTYAAGGTLDLVTRAYAERLSILLGQPVVVENRPGASGMVGAEAVRRSRNDGYTLLAGTPAELAFNKYLFSKMPYEPSTDFEPVSLMATHPFMFVANSGLGINTYKELLEHSTKSPNPLPYASPGPGTTMHLVGEWLGSNTGLKLTHIPYKGGGEAVKDFVAGEVPLAVLGYAPIAQFLAAGKVHVLAVTSAKRSSLLPDAPTLRELGVSFDSEQWYAVLAPKGTQPEIVAKLNAAIREASQDPKLKKTMIVLGAEARSSTPEEVSEFMRSDSEKYGKLIANAKLKVQ